MLGVSLSTFKDTVRAELPVVRIGRRVMFERKDLEAWAREHNVGGSSGFQKGADAGRTSYGSGTTGNASNVARVEAIRLKLLSKPRASTRT